MSILDKKKLEELKEAAEKVEMDKYDAAGFGFTIEQKEALILLEGATEDIMKAMREIVISLGESFGNIVVALREGGIITQADEKNKPNKYMRRKKSWQKKRFYE